jgi:hypothetical protein
VSTTLESYRPGTRSLSPPVRVWCGVASARIFLVDVLPVLARHWTRQRIRDAVRRLTFLTADEREAVERWLRARGF